MLKRIEKINDFLEFRREFNSKQEKNPDAEQSHTANELDEYKAAILKNSFCSQIKELNSLLDSIVLNGEHSRLLPSLSQVFSEFYQELDINTLIVDLKARLNDD